MLLAVDGDAGTNALPLGLQKGPEIKNPTGLRKTSSASVWLAVDGDAGARALLAHLVPPLGWLAAFVLRYWPHLQAQRSGGPFARAAVSVWRQAADFLDTHLSCITK